MRLPLWLLALLVLAFACPQATRATQTTDTARQELSEQLAKLKFSQARFRQQRHLAVLSRPLLSEGEIKLLEGRRLEWRQSQPYVAVVSMSPEEIREQVPGQEPRVITARDNPLMSAVAQAYVALLNGEIDRLEGLFTADLVRDGMAWTLTLVPRLAALAQAIARIEVRGDQHIREISIEEKSGDRSQIELYDHQPAGTP